jgi:hypothetical protein
MKDRASHRIRVVIVTLLTSAFTLWAQDPVTPPPQWRAASVQDVADCTLLVEADGKSKGTAFLCNEAGKTYIVTNLHVIYAAKSLVFKDSKEVTYRDIAYAEVPAAPWGTFEIGGSLIGGGDMVRFCLNGLREKALTFQQGPQPPLVGSNVVVAGNKNGEGAVVIAEGVIKEVEGQIIRHDAPSAGGNSGSAIVNADTFDVIGIETWGPQKVQADKWVWQDGLRIEEGGGIGWGAGLFEPPIWIQVPAKRILEEGYRLEEFKRKIRILGLLDIIEPTAEGLFIDPKKEIKYGKTVESILAESAGDDTIRYLVKLDEKLARNRESNISMSIQDVYKNYMSALKYAWQDTTQDRESIERIGKPYFYECLYKTSKVLQVSKIYEDSMNAAYTWYDSELSVGNTFVLGERPRLPSLDSEVWKKMIDYVEN